jgi:hypothetical protein
MLQFVYNFTIVGYFTVVGIVSGVLIYPVSQWIIEGIGHMNIIYSGIICEAARLVVFASVKYVN